jgi:hypothetical protein
MSTHGTYFFIYVLSLSHTHTHTHTNTHTRSREAVNFARGSGSVYMSGLDFLCGGISWLIMVEMVF